MKLILKLKEEKKNINNPNPSHGHEVFGLDSFVPAPEPHLYEVT